MPSRRVIGIGVAGAAVTVVAGVIIVLFAGPSKQITRPYSSSHTFISTVGDLCVEATVHGTITATRSGTAPLVHWTDVHLTDPTMTAAGYTLTDHRCDHTRPLSLAATLQQNWSTDGTTPVSRRTNEGPATGELRQFNSATPVHLPPRAFPSSLTDPDYPIDGQILVDARFPTLSEGFGYRTHFTLTASPSPDPTR